MILTYRLNPTKELIKKKLFLKFSGSPNGRSVVEKLSGIHMKLNGIGEEKIRRKDKILNGIVEEDETTVIPWSLNTKGKHNMDKFFSNSLAESIGKLANGCTSQAQHENCQVI
jgi:hypothetical protein